MAPIPLVRFVAILSAILGFLAPPVMAQIGGLDPGFAPPAILNGASPGTVRAVYWQANGQVIIAGEFTSIGGTPCGRIARLNADGALDATFAPNAGADGIVHTLAVQSDGKMIIGGEFTNVDGTARNRIARLTTTGTLDTTFNPGTGCNGPVYATLLSGTSVIIGGDFTTVNGTTRTRIAKLTSTGTLDCSSFTSGGANAAVYSLAADVTNSSFALVGGAFTTFNGGARSRLARVFVSSGSADSFNSTGGPNNTVYAMACVGDGASVGGLYIGGDFTSVNSISRGRVARYSGSGTSWVLDQAFTFSLDGTCRTLRITGSGAGGSLRAYAGGDFTSVDAQAHGRVARFKYVYVPGGGGSSSYWDMDTTYSTSTPAGANGTIYAIQLTADGKAYLGGTFTTVDGTGTQTAARLYGDAGSQPPSTPAGLTATVLSSSQINVSWNTTANASSYSPERSFDGSTGWTVMTYSGTSAMDSGLAPGTTAHYRLKAINSNGSSAYTANVTAATPATVWTGSGSLSTAPTAGATNGTVSDIIQQPDGKIFIAGNFTTVLGQPRNYVARLLSDFTLDTTFDPGTGPNSSVSKLGLMPDGRIYLFGNFTSVSSPARKSLARLNTNGTHDTSFDPGSTGTFLNTIAVQSDGRLLVGGGFDVFFDGGFAGSGIEYLVRLNINGTVDTSFNAYPSATVYSIGVQPDGHIVIGGSFSTVRGAPRSNLARLTSTGQLDTSFSPTSPSLPKILALNNGRILIYGTFTSVNSVARNNVAILNSDGTLDATFVTDATTGPNAAVSAVAQQPDGKFIITGSFTSVGTTPRWGIARLNANGSLDTTFDAGAGTAPSTSGINVATVLTDSSIAIGGSFTNFGIGTQSYLARVNGDGVSLAPPTPVAPIITALTSGSVQLSWIDVTGESSWKIERSTDGLTWVPIAVVPFDYTSYTDTGLATGTNYSYRLRASNFAGDSAPSSTGSSTTFTAYQQWKVNNGYSTTEPDNSDSDNDGITTILEYALGLDPHVADVNSLPVGQTLNGTVALSYRKYRSDVTYTVEASTDLVTWSSVGVNQGSVPFPIAWKLIGTEPQIYLRLSVAVP